MPDTSSATTALPDFVLTRGGQKLTVSDTMHPVSEHDALATAKANNSIVVGLIPFDPSEPARLHVPENYSWEERWTAASGSQALHQIPAPAQITGLDNSAFRQAVATSVAKMNNGELDKVVLSRLLTLDYAEQLDPAAIYQNLTQLQPKAYVFSAKLDDNKYLMGASPELVFKVENKKLSTHPLAGSATRIPGTTLTDDAQIGEELMRSAKDRAEHATVVDDIKTRLTPLTDELTVPPVPTLLTTPQLWHLGTRITGVLKENLSSLDGARAIHPTPAICGAPREKALDLIHELEDFERGFFGGLVGWMDADGNGEWALILRCAEISEQQAQLFAGCGVVKDSKPALEHAETATKLASFAQALGLDLTTL